MGLASIILGFLTDIMVPTDAFSPAKATSFLVSGAIGIGSSVGTAGNVLGEDENAAKEEEAAAATEKD
ncbi:hypothetical protein N7492_004364 [Penicillium capsulatum]|uniref:Uncharacterized protein n=1 Tax=Penicillium capsulatum TaxID=69766 RepID=A0A9W9I7R5_9EURO|nr:hypothetical protein N7492_004364 [Penicillium capsulatum]